LIWAKLIFVVALIASLAYAAHAYNEHYRAEGRAEVQAKWDAAIKLANEIEAKAAIAREADLEKANADRDKRFKALAGRYAALQARLAAESVGPATVDGLLDAVRTANAEGAAASTARNSTPSSGTTGDQLAPWFADIAEKYARCKRQVVCWNDFWDGKEGGACGTL
jgi:hypothetical protein